MDWLPLRWPLLLVAYEALQTVRTQTNLVKYNYPIIFNFF